MSESGSAWEEMLDTRQVECSCGTLWDISKDISIFSSESQKLLADELLQVRGDESYDQTSKDIAFEHLLVNLEHKYNDPFLDFNTFNLKKGFRIKELSGLEYSFAQANIDNLNSCIIEGEKPLYNLFDESSKGINDDITDGINNLPDIAEEFLLDAEFEECVSTFYYVSSKEYSRDNLNLNQQLVSGQSQSGSKKVELFTTVKLVSEAETYTNSALLDKMTTDELHKAFTKVFYRETIIMDREWLKNRILFGLQNLGLSNNCLNLLEFHATSFDNNGDMGSENNEPLQRASSPFTEVFRFKTKPRSQHMKRQRHVECDYLKTFSFNISKCAPRLPDLGERNSVIATNATVCKPAQRCMDGSVAKRLRSQKRKSENSAAVSKDKPLYITYKRRYTHKGFREPVSVNDVGKKTSDGDCTHPPFGPLLDKESSRDKGYEFVASSEVGSLGSLVDSDVEHYGAESQDFSSQDESIGITKVWKSKGTKKNYTQWSLLEVQTLIDGVSKFGVGRWSEMKKFLFSSPPHRSPVDLKDKWRNLVRAIQKRSQSTSKAKSRHKHGHFLPQEILDRVMELAVEYPYPRKHAAKVSKHEGATFKFSVGNCENPLSLSMTVNI